MDDAALIEIGRAALRGLEDRRGLRETIQEIRREDQATFQDMCLEAGRAAVAEMKKNA